MKKHLGVALAAVFALTPAAPAFAQDNVGGLGGYEGTDGTIFKFFGASSIYFAVKYQCKDLSGTSTTISAAIADCCIFGDLWRATIWKGNSNKTFATVANAPGFVAGALPFAPDVYSPEGLIVGRVSSVYVLATLGNTAPAGFTAGGTLRITTNGGNATCVRKQLAGGFADP